LARPRSAGALTPANEVVHQEIIQDESLDGTPASLERVGEHAAADCPVDRAQRLQMLQECVDIVANSMRVPSSCRRPYSAFGAM
jgi:hypothetical protein